MGVGVLTCQLDWDWCDMMTKTTVIFGATSILGQKLAQTYGQQGHRLILAGRSKDELSRVASDVRVRFCCQADTVHFDAAKISKSTNLAARIEKKFGDIDNAILVFGDMGDAQNGDLESLEQCIRVNFLGAACLAESIAERMVTRGSGSIIGISSVAGDRGRKKKLPLWQCKRRLHPVSSRSPQQTFRGERTCDDCAAWLYGLSDDLWTEVADSNR